MKVRKVTKPVYITSDGTYFGNEEEAKKYEFDQWYKSNAPQELGADYISYWLRNNKNAILAHIGTTFDPETEESRET